MTPAQCFDHNGRLQPFDGRPDEPYLYQWVHVLDGQPLRLDAHLHLLGTAYRALFGGDFRFDTAGIARRIEAMLRANRYPLSGSSFVRLRLYASGETALLPGGVSLYAGYALRSLRPSAVTVCCELPYDDRPT